MSRTRQQEPENEPAYRHESGRTQRGAVRAEPVCDSSSAPAAIVRLQRTIGNRAVQRLLGERNGQRDLAPVSRLPDTLAVAPPQNEVDIEVSSGTAVGSEKFYRAARPANQYYSHHPPKPGWPYSERLKSLWGTLQYDEFASEVGEFQSFGLKLSDDQVDGILGPKTSRKLAEKIAKESARANSGGNGARRKNPLDMTVAEFEASVEGQLDLFDMAKETRGRQQKFANAILAASKVAGIASSMLKRDDFDSFIKGVIEKCKRKGYARIGQMDDIVRGRFNLDLGPDVEKIAIALQKQTEFPVTTVERPRRPNQYGYGYPRWHVVVHDTSGITHEWQVGTQAVTEVYEKRGIVIPSAVGALPEGMHNDIHDIEYDILRRIQEDHPDIAASVGIPEFRHRVDLISAQAGSQGKNMPELDKRIDELHGSCSTILKDLVAQHGPEIIRKYFKR